MSCQAKKLIADATPAHMQARTVLNTLQEHLTVLFPPPPPSKFRNTIWLPRVPSFNAGEKALVARWRAYLKWEESNPLEIEEKDKAQAAINFVVFAVMAFTSFASGALVTTQGWNLLNVGSIAPLALTAAALGWLALLRRRAADGQGA